MTYSEIVSQVKSEIRFEQDQNADTLIEQCVNRAYRTLSAQQIWRELTVHGESFTTESAQTDYDAPYVFANVVPNSMLYDYDSSTATGSPLEVIVNPTIAARMGWFGQGNAPFAATVSGVAGTNLYDTGTVAIANESRTVTGTGTAWASSSHDGQWMRFGYQSSGDLSGGNYGYKIASVDSGTQITLEEGYRGAALTAAKYAIRPSTTPQIKLSPAFSDYGQTVKYSFTRWPRRLYNGDDTPEVEILSDVLVSEACALLAQYSEDVKRYAVYKQRAKEQYRSIIGQLAY